MTVDQLSNSSQSDSGDTKPLCRYPDLPNYIWAIEGRRVLSMFFMSLVRNGKEPQNGPYFIEVCTYRMRRIASHRKSCQLFCNASRAFSGGGSLDLTRPSFYTDVLLGLWWSILVKNVFFHLQCPSFAQIPLLVFEDDWKYLCMISWHWIEVLVSKITQ